MSIVAKEGQIESTEKLFTNQNEAKIPPSLARASLRLEFPPSYVVVGVYRFLTDKSLYGPAWDKCRHAARRGFIVAGIWTCISFKLQRAFVAIFLINSARITGLAHDTIFGFQNPFDLPTYATVLFLSSQITFILTFFMRRNLRIARERAWDQTVASRGKGKDFWQPYVEEWEFPPIVDESPKGLIQRALKSYVGQFAFRQILLFPFALNPFIRNLFSAAIRSMGTARYLHQPYFKAKNMTHHQAAIFLEERKWDYRIFGFTAALLEGLPIIGLIFSISNRVGAAMWAHDLEKRQHFVASERLARDE